MSSDRDSRNLFKSLELETPETCDNKELDDAIRLIFRSQGGYSLGENFVEYNDLVSALSSHDVFAAMFCARALGDRITPYSKDILDKLISCTNKVILDLVKVVLDYAFCVEAKDFEFIDFKLIDFQVKRLKEFGFSVPVKFNDQLRVADFRTIEHFMDTEQYSRAEELRLLIEERWGYSFGPEFAENLRILENDLLRDEVSEALSEGDFAIAHIMAESLMERGENIPELVVDEIHKQMTQLYISRLRTIIDEGDYSSALEMIAIIEADGFEIPDELDVRNTESQRLMVELVSRIEKDELFEAKALIPEIENQGIEISDEIRMKLCGGSVEQVLEELQGYIEKGDLVRIAYIRSAMDWIGEEIMAEMLEKIEELVMEESFKKFREKIDKDDFYHTGGIFQDFRNQNVVVPDELIKHYLLSLCKEGKGRRDIFHHFEYIIADFEKRGIELPEEIRGQIVGRKV